MPNHPGHRTRHRRHSGRAFQGAAAFGLVTLVVVCLAAPVCLNAQSPPPGFEPDRTDTTRTVAVNLYFADSTRFALLAERRQLPRPANPVDFAKNILRELSAGPRNRRLAQTLPEDDILRSFFIDADKTAYVDLGDAMWAQHPGGVQAELLALYSIVNSLVLNMAEIDAVKLLSRGREPTPETGHVDLRYPLKANILLVR